MELLVYLLGWVGSHLHGVPLFFFRFSQLFFAMKEEWLLNRSIYLNTHYLYLLLGNYYININIYYYMASGYRIENN